LVAVEGRIGPGWFGWRRAGGIERSPADVDFSLIFSVSGRPETGWFGERRRPDSNRGWRFCRPSKVSVARYSEGHKGNSAKKLCPTGIWVLVHFRPPFSSKTLQNRRNVVEECCTTNVGVISGCSEIDDWSRDCPPDPVQSTTRQDVAPWVCTRLILHGCRPSKAQERMHHSMISVVVETQASWAAWRCTGPARGS
jgi:hypothetical protein